MFLNSFQVWTYYFGCSLILLQTFNLFIWSNFVLKMNKFNWKLKRPGVCKVQHFPLFDFSSLSRRHKMQLVTKDFSSFLQTFVWLKKSGDIKENHLNVTFNESRTFQSRQSQTCNMNHKLHDSTFIWPMRWEIVFLLFFPSFFYTNTAKILRKKLRKDLWFCACVYC